ncbi:MAG: nucleoside triphosphate pyrophosphohydrolase [Actinobacteria bacterium]|nr:nucleoside triphosphate pyrophosphohydrolase [Actinomycetota bacterium]
MTGPITVVGLGPAGLDRVAAPAVAVLTDEATAVLVRTLRHPAAAELAARREVATADDLYDTASGYDEVYGGIVARVLDMAAAGPVAYAVPGSAVVGERAAAMLRDEAAARGIPLTLHAGESFIDAALEALGVDPLADGLQVLDGRDLPDPLLLHLPTLISQVDTGLVLMDVRERLGRLLPDETAVTVLDSLGGSGQRVEETTLADLRPERAGDRVTLFLAVEAPGWPGLIRTNARLRRECPWDREQTHHTLAKHLLEEAYEVLDALEALPPEAPGGDPDYAGYTEVEEELGDLLLQVVFHATLAEEARAFGIEEVAEAIRRKLIRRHPHVFGDVDAATAERVVANWEALKQEEKQRESVLDGVSRSMPALARSHELQSRAAAVGFDWPSIDGVVAKVREELGELLDDLDDPARAAHELGDLLFSVVNLARHLAVDPEQAMRAAADRFDRRFRSVEAGGSLSGLTLEEMDRRWEAAKANERD